MDDAEERPVTAVERILFTPLYYPRTTWSVVGWWESRRLFYNAVVGGAGLVTLATMLATWGPPEEGVAFIGPVVYGVLANICYTMGSVTDIGLRKLLGDRAPAVGPVLYRYGLVFSVGLTLLPAPIFLASKILSLIFG